MGRFLLQYKSVTFVLMAVLFAAKTGKLYAQHAANDTIVSYAIIYQGDTIEAKTLQSVLLFRRLSDDQRRARAEWTRLRNAIYILFLMQKGQAL